MKSSEPCRLSPCLRSHPGAGAPIVYLEGRSERQWRWLRGLRLSFFPVHRQRIVYVLRVRIVMFHIGLYGLCLQSCKFQGFSKFKSNPPNKQLRFTLPETNSSSPLKVDGWKMTFPFGFRPILRGFCC